MKPMKTFIAILFALVLPIYAAKPPGTVWKVYCWGNSGLYKGKSAGGVSGDISTFNFPLDSGGNTAYPAFLTTTVDTTLLGNLTGKTLTANVTITASPDVVFRFGGQDTWNFGPAPANTRLYFSTTAETYNLNDANNHQDDYWWSQVAWAQVQASTFTLTDTFDPAHWSNAQGGQATNRLAAFQAAVANVRQIGVSFGGGFFFDTGCAVTAGSATFHLTGYTAQ